MVVMILLAQSPLTAQPFTFKLSKSVLVRPCADVQCGRVINDNMLYMFSHWHEEWPVHQIMHIWLRIWVGYSAYQRFSKMQKQWVIRDNPFVEGCHTKPHVTSFTMDDIFQVMLLWASQTMITMEYLAYPRQSPWIKTYNAQWQFLKIISLISVHPCYKCLHHLPLATYLHHLILATYIVIIRS